MPEFLRVRDKATGHEYTIHAARFNDAAHAVVDDPALDHHGDPAPPKYRTAAAKQTSGSGPARKRTTAKRATAKRTSAAKKTAATKTAKQADTKKES